MKTSISDYERMIEEMHDCIDGLLRLMRVAPAHSRHSLVARLAELTAELMNLRETYTALLTTSYAHVTDTPL